MNIMQRCLVVALLCLAPSPLFSQFWRPVYNDLRGTVYGVDCTTRGALLASTGADSIIRSTDHGATWTKLTFNVSPAPKGYSLLAIKGPDTLWMANGAAAYVSVDDGISWTSAGKLPFAGFPPFTPGLRITCIAFDRLGRPMLGTEGGLFRSENKTWKKIPIPMYQDSLVSSLAVTRTGTIIAVSRNEVHRSTDNGASWEMVVHWPFDRSTDKLEAAASLAGPDGTIMASVAITGRSFGATFATRSTDDGASWSTMTTPQIDNLPEFVNAYRTHPSGDYYLSMWPSGDVARSTDRGMTWNVMEFDIGMEGYYHLLFEYGNRLAIDSTGVMHATTRRDGCDTCINLVIHDPAASADEEVSEVERAMLQVLGSSTGGVSTLRCTLPSTGHVELYVADLAGRRVSTLLDEHRGTGTFDVQWNGGGVAPGIYIGVMKTSSGIVSARMLVR